MGSRYVDPVDVAKVLHLQGNLIQYLPQGKQINLYQSSLHSHQCGGAAIFRQCYGFGKNWYISSPNTVICPRSRTAIHASSNCKTFSEQCLSTVTTLSYSRISFVHIRLRNEVQPNLAFFYFSEEQLLFWNCPFGMTELIRTPK